MTPTNDTSPELHERFLLGDLAAGELSRFEQRLLNDPDLFEQVEAAEGELVDRYVRDELEADERRRFEERLLLSERIRERVRTARSLRKLAERSAASALEPNDGAVVRHLPPPAAGAGREVHRPVSTTQWLAWAACLVALVAAGVLALTSLRLQDRLDTLQEAHRGTVERALSAEERAEELHATAERARAQDAARVEQIERLHEQLDAGEERIAGLEERIERSAHEESAGTDAVRLTTVFLALANRADELQTLQLSTASDEVELVLDLDRLRMGDDLTVTLQHSRSDVPNWQKSGLEPTYTGPDGILSVALPIELFQPGEYRVEIKGPGGDTGDPIQSYHLMVQP
ncbi:MAG: hypothetical protein PVG07_00665 [Acidobacteriota bacterium]|jgi:hypothetical protein